MSTTQPAWDRLRGRLFGVARPLSVLAIGATLASCGPQSEVEAHPGKAIYQRYCYACHQAGIADAPKFGDKEAWAPRLAQSRTELVDNVMRGMPPGMPPRGACAACTDEALEAAVDYMVLRAQ